VPRSLLLAVLTALILTPAAQAAPTSTCKAKRHAVKCAKASRSEVLSGGGGLI
jgi:hypothetical protein